jgi:flagellar biosynthesis/type III secretory pathway protein FliH
LVLRLVVLSELARTRETVLLRLLGSGRVLREALADVANLPEDAWERAVATPILIHFRLEVPAVQSADDDVDDVEADVSEAIRAWYKEYEKNLRLEAAKEGLIEGMKQGMTEGLKEGRAEGLKVGMREGERKALTKLLQARFGALPLTVITRIEAAELSDIERWLERVLTSTTLSDIFGDAVV